MQEKIFLSNRLKTIASFISKSASFIDVGSDHGYLPCYVCQNDPHAKAIASEVKEGPLLRTKKTVAMYNLTDRIDVRLGDGLSVLHEDDCVNEIVIAGMGGTLITNILSAGLHHVLRAEKLIVQPNNNEHKLRKFFIEHSFTLINEVILEENNQLYEILVAQKSIDQKNNPYREEIPIEIQLMFGPFLLQEKSPEFQIKWQREKEKIIKILDQIERTTNENIEKIHYFERQLKIIEEVLQ